MSINNVFSVNRKTLITSLTMIFIVLSVFATPLITIPTYAQTGSITIRIHNVPGTSMPESGGTIIVYLYKWDSGNKTWVYVANNTLNYQGGANSIDTSFTNIEFGEWYYFAIVHKPLNGLGLKEFWGLRRFRLDNLGGGYVNITLYTYDFNNGKWVLYTSYTSLLPVRVDFYRSEPYIVGSDVDYQTSVVSGDAIIFKIPVKNNEAVSRTLYVTAILDRDLKPPYDVIVNSTSFTLSPGEVKTISLTIIAPSPGTYTPYILLSFYYPDIDWHRVMVDQWDGSWRPINVASTPTPTPTVPKATMTIHQYLQLDLAKGVDSDGDGLREYVVEISVPSLPSYAYMDVLVLRADIPAVSARLFDPSGREIPVTATWDGHYRWVMPSAPSGVYKLYLEEAQRSSTATVRIMTPIYAIEDNIIKPFGGYGAPAKWMSYDLYTSIDEKGYSPVIWQIEPQVVTVDPGQEFDLRINFTIRQFSYHPPGIIWQVFLVYSWSPTWPPPEGYYYTLYDGIPSYEGVTIEKTVRIKAPDKPGEYYIYVGMCQHYGMEYVLEGLTRKPDPPAHAKIIVKTPVNTTLETDVKILSPTNDVTLDRVPMYRPFRLRVYLTNNLDSAVSYRVVLEERTGFVAGLRYGDGDEVRNVVIPPRSSIYVDFPAEVYGVPRSSDYARILIYDGNSLVKEVRHRINLTIDYASITAVVHDPIVQRGIDSVVYVAVEYSLTYETSVVIEVLSNESVIARESTMLRGASIEAFKLVIPRNMLGESGSKNFKVRLSLYMPEKNYEQLILRYKDLEGINPVTESEFRIGIAPDSSTGLPSIRLTGGYLYIEYKGNRYLALRFINLTQVNCATLEGVERFRCFSSTYGWIIFNVSSNNMGIVMDDELHGELAFIAEIALRRFGTWTPGNIDYWAKLFEEVSQTSYALETLLVGVEILSLQAKTLLSQLYPPYGLYIATSEDALKPLDILIDSGYVIWYLSSMDFANMLQFALEKANFSVDIAFAYVAATLLQNSATGLRNANQHLRIIDIGSTVDSDDALSFYSKYIEAWSIGYPSYRLLVTRYSDQWLAFKVFAEELVGKPAEIYDKIRNQLEGGSKEVGDFYRSLTYQYKLAELEEAFIKEASIRFRNEYLKNLGSNYNVIRLVEPPDQRNIRIMIITPDGRKVGYNPGTGEVYAEINGSLYIDLGNEELIIAPVDTYRLIVDASQAEEAVERYEIQIIKYVNGEVSAITTLGGKEIGKDEKHEYNVEAGAINIETQTTTPPTTTTASPVTTTTFPTTTATTLSPTPTTTTVTTQAGEAVSLPLVLVATSIVIVAVAVTVLLLRRK